MEKVRYKPVPDYPAYRVGTDGSVWSKWRRVGGRKRGSVIGDEWRRMKPYDSKKAGRSQVTLKNDSGFKLVGVHRIVLLAFKGPPPPEKPIAAHNNGNPFDNRLCNLRWASQKENMADKYKHGTEQRGERHPGVKLTEAQVLSARRRCRDGETITALAEEYGVWFGTMWSAVNGKTWKHLKEEV